MRISFLLLAAMFTASALWSPALARRDRVPRPGDRRALIDGVVPRGQRLHTLPNGMVPFICDVQDIHHQDAHYVNDGNRLVLSIDNNEGMEPDTSCESAGGFYDLPQRTPFHSFSVEAKSTGGANIGSPTVFIQIYPGTYSNFGSFSQGSFGPTSPDQYTPITIDVDKTSFAGLPISKMWIVVSDSSEGSIKLDNIRINGQRVPEIMQTVEICPFKASPSCKH